MIKKLEQSDIYDICNNIYNMTYQKNIIVSINLLRLGKPTFPLVNLIYDIKKYLQPRSIAIQTYSRFENLKSREFSRFHTSIIQELSSFSKEVFKSFAQYRALSATHSFIFLDEKFNKNHIFKSAFGVDSTFEYLVKNEYLWVNLGCYLNETCTFLHYVEDSNLVYIPFKERINLPVKIIKDIDKIESEEINYIYHRKTKEFIDKYHESWIPLEKNNLIEKCSLSNSSIPISIYPLDLIYQIGGELIRRNPYSLTKKLF